MLRLAYGVLALCGSATVLGCGASGPTTYEVTGRVTFDGKPVTDGEIIFRAAEGSERSWAGPIVDGRYTMQSTAGKKRVEISASRQVADVAVTGGGGEGPGFEMYIPEKYNSRSELQIQIAPDWGKEFDFELEP